MSENPNLAKNPPIEQIRLGTQLYDIKTKKDWAENSTEDIGYIQNRTHYFYDVPQEQLKNAFAAAGTDTDTEEYTGLREQFTVYHEFKNRYYANGDLNYRDYWYPNVSWLEEGKPYRLIIKTTGTSDAKTKDIVLERVTVTDTTSGETTIADSVVLYEEAGKNRIVYSFLDKNIFVQYEDKAPNTETGFIETNGYSLRIIPNIDYDWQGNEPLTYNAVKYLDAGFLPLDPSIHINSEGKLAVEDVFPNDFRVSYQFGQYIANTTVPATKKAVKDVILDAFCKDVSPTDNILPKIDKFKITPSTLPDEKGYYELGEAVNYKYEVKFDPGVYQFDVATIGGESVDDATSDIVIESHNGTFTHGSPTAIGNDTHEFVTNKGDAVDAYTAIGWGTGDNRFATLTGENNTIKMPSEPNDNIQAEYLVKFDHINLKGIDNTETRATATLGYLPCTMFGYPIETSKVSDTCFHTRISDRTCTATIEAFKCDYRWFWGYVATGENAEPGENIREWLLTKKSKLGGFDSEFKTFRMKAMYFLAPEGQVESFEVEAADGSNPIMVEQIKGPITINDAGGTLHAYDVWVFQNTVPDIGTHNYKIKYIKKEEAN